MSLDIDFDATVDSVPPSDPRRTGDGRLMLFDTRTGRRRTRLSLFRAYDRTFEILHGKKRYTNLSPDTAKKIIKALAPDAIPPEEARAESAV